MHIRATTQPHKRKTVYAGIAVVVVLVAGTFFRTPIPEWAESVFMRAARLVWVGEREAGKSAPVAGVLQSRTALRKENVALRDALFDARLELVDRRMLREENRELRMLLGQATTTEDILIGTVVGRPHATVYDTLLVDVGGGIGVTPGDIVLAGGAVVLGTVDEVVGQVARVRLFSSPGEETPAFLPESDTALTAHGAGGGNFTMRLPSEIEVREGAPVILSGSREGRILGSVAEREIIPGDLFQTIRFRSPVNVNALRTVRIERSN